MTVQTEPSVVDDGTQPAIPMAKPWFGEEEAVAAADAVRSGWVSQGQRVIDFEQAVARYVGSEHAVAVSSCTAALHLSLVLLGVGPGDEVVVPSLTFIATANVVRHVGATPVFADVDPNTHNISPETVKSVVTDRTRAVIVVHQCGVPAELDALRGMTSELGLELIEDAACAIGSTYRGRPIGGDSGLAAFSFHPRKLVVTGEGGMLTTHDSEWAARLRRLREHGMNASPFERHLSKRVVLESYLESGFNYRMTDMQGALGVVQTGKLSAMVQRRRLLAANYHALLEAVPGVQAIQDPSYGLGNFQTFWIVLPDDYPISRNGLLDELSRKGVSARRGLTAVHREPAFADLPLAHLPVTEHISERSLLLPMFHGLTEVQQERVVGVIARPEGTSSC